MKLTKSQLKKIIKEEIQNLNEIDFDKVQLPSKVKRFMGKFVDSMKDAKLNRMKRSAILYKVIQAAGISTQTLMADIQLIKQGLKKEVKIKEDDGFANYDDKGKDTSTKFKKNKKTGAQKVKEANKWIRKGKQSNTKYHYSLEEKGGKKPGGKHLIYVLTKELKKAQQVLKQGGFKEGKHFSIQPNPGSKKTMGILMDKKVLNKVLEKFVGSKVNVYENKINEGASPKIMKMINDTMRNDSFYDFEELIDSLNLDKKYWKVIDEYLNDMRDVQMGVQPEGYDDPARKFLPKILKKAVITKRK